MALRKFDPMTYDALEEILELYWRVESLAPGDPVMEEMADVERRAYLKSMQAIINDTRASLYSTENDVEEIDLAIMREIIRTGGRDWKRSFTDDSIKRRQLKISTATALMDLATDEGTEAAMEEARRAAVLEKSQPPLPEDRDWLLEEKESRASEVSEIDDLIELIDNPPPLP